MVKPINIVFLCCLSCNVIRTAASTMDAGCWPHTGAHSWLTHRARSFVISFSSRGTNCRRIHVNSLVHGKILWMLEFYMGKGNCAIIKIDKIRCNHIFKRRDRRAQCVRRLGADSIEWFLCSSARIRIFHHILRSHCLWSRDASDGGRQVSVCLCVN